MKRLLTAAALLLSLATSSDALTIDYETISGTRISSPYGWNFSYDIGVINDVLSIDVDIMLTGATVVDSLLARWENGIESIWSTDRFSVPIAFNVDWVETAADYVVRVTDGPGRWTMRSWFTQGGSFWGDSFQEEVAAHEYGHMIALWDQYAEGAVDPVTRLVTNGLMGSLAGGTLDSYYSDFLGWYEDHLTAYDPGDEPIPTPEPGTVVLFAAGMFALAVRMKRREV